MANNEEKLGSLQVEIEANVAKFKRDLENLRGEAEKKAQTIQDAFSRRKIAFDNKFAKMRINELQGEYKRLQAEFQKKLTLNVSTLSLKATKDELNQVRGALDDIQPAQKKSLTGWALGITAVNQAYQFLTSTFTNLKNILSDAVRSSTQLEVLRANFKGNAEDLELFKKATADTVSEANLIKLSNQATDLGVSLKDQALLFSLAEDAADKYGTGVEEGMMKVITASEGNIRGLNFLGIQKKVYEGIVNDLARAQGDEINNLDAETQKQIRLQAIIQASGVTLEDVTNKVKDNADKIQSLTVRVEEAKVRLGELISKALLPLIDAFDKSGKTGKDFASVIIGGVSILGSFIPLLIQVKSAQALMAASTAASTTALEANSVALGTNAAAGAGWLSKFGIGIFAAIGVAIGVGAGKLIDYIKYDLPNEINEASKEAADKIKIPEAFSNFLNSGKRIIVGKNGKLETIQIVAPEDKKNWTEVDKTAGEILKKITALTKANEDVNISVDDYKKNLEEIDRLQNILSINKEKEKNAIDEIIKKLQTENEIKSLTVGLSVELLESAKASLQAMLPLVKTEEDRLKILKEIANVSNQITGIKNKDFETKELGLSTLKEIDKANKEAQDKVKKQGLDYDKDRKSSFEELNQLRISAIENEFSQREASIKLEFELRNEHLKELALTEEELQEALQDNLKIKQNELSKLERDRFNNMLSVANQIGDLLINKLGIAGHTFVGQMMQAVDLAIEILSILNQIGATKGIFDFVASFIPGGSIISGLSGAMAGGGPVERDKVYKVGEHGVELFKPSTSGMIIPNHEIRTNINQTGKGLQSVFQNTNAEKILTEISNRIGAMNMNIVQLELGVSVINNSPDVKSTVTKHKQIENSMARGGKNFSER